VATKKEKVEYTKPTTQLDLEARLGEDAPEAFYSDVNPGTDSVLNGTEKNDENKSVYATASGDDYIGTDPIYQNHSEDTLKPLKAEEGVEKDAEEEYFRTFEKGNEPGEQLQSVYGDTTANSPKLGDDSSSDESDTEEEESTSSSGSTSNTQQS
jgi:hypothetical protein